MRGNWEVLNVRFVQVSLLALAVLVMCSGIGGGESYALSGAVQDEEGMEQGSVQDEGIQIDFALRNLNKETFRLSDYRGKKPVILFFWTTWCVNCRAGIRAMNEMYPQIVKEGFEVLAINVGESASKVDRFVKTYDLRFKVLLDPDTNTARAFKLIGVPTYILIDKKGHLRFYDHYFPKNDYNRLMDN